MGTEGRNQIPNGKTFLMIACEQGRSLDVKILLQKKPLLVASRDRSGKTALHYCAETGSIACAQQILSADASLIHAQDKDGYSPLHLAVIAGNRHMVKFLLKRGADANSVDKERHSCVHWATVCGDLDTLEILLTHGATPSTADMLGAYPIHYASQMCGPHSLMGNDTRIGVATLRKLIRGGAPIHCRDRDGREPILWAASAGSSEAVLLLFTAGANISTADKDGLTALHCAASRGHTNCVETLVTLCGAGVNVGDTIGCSPLFYAAAQGHADASQTLLKYGADPNLQDHKGRTPGHCAATKGQLETIRILDSNGADLWIRNSRGNLPLHEAVQCGRKDLVQWLLQQNPPAANATNISGRTPLHIAAQANNVEMCEVLIDYGAYINPLMVNPKGFLMTPLDAAVHQGNQRCAKYIQLHGGVLAKKVLENNGINRNLLYSLGNYAARRKDQDDDVASVTSGENRAARPSNIKIETKDEVSLQPQVASPPPSPTDSLLTNVRSESADASVHIHLSREDLWSLWESFMHSEIQSDERGESECSLSDELDHRVRDTAEATHRLKPALVTNVYLVNEKRKNTPQATATEQNYSKDALLQLPKDATKIDSSDAPESCQGSSVTRIISVSASRKEIFVSKNKERLESLPATSLPSTVELQRMRNSDSVQLEGEERNTCSSDISGISIVRKNEEVFGGESSVGSDTEEVLLIKRQKMAKLRKKRSDGRPEGREIAESETSSGIRQADHKERYLHNRKLHQKSDRSPDNRLPLYKEKHRHGLSGSIRGAVSYDERVAHAETNRERNFNYVKESRTTYSKTTEQGQPEMQLLRTQRSSRHNPSDNLQRGRIHIEAEPHFTNVLPQYEELVKETAVTGDHHLHYHHHHHHHHYHHVHEQESHVIVNSERDLSNVSISGAQEIEDNLRSQRGKHRQSRRRFKLNWKPKLHRNNRTRRHKSDNEFYSRERYERVKTKEVVRSKSAVCLDRNTRYLITRESTGSVKDADGRRNFREGISEVPNEMEENVEPNDFVRRESRLTTQRQHTRVTSTKETEGEMNQEILKDNRKSMDLQFQEDLQDRLVKSSQKSLTQGGSSENLIQDLSDTHSRNTQLPSRQEISALNLLKDNAKGVVENSAEQLHTESNVNASGDNFAPESKKLPDKTIGNRESPNGKPLEDDTTESDEESSSENDYTVKENIDLLNKMDNNIPNEEIDDNMMQTSEDEAIVMDEVVQSTDDTAEKDASQHLDFDNLDVNSDEIPSTKQHSLSDKPFEGSERERDSARATQVESGPTASLHGKATDHGGLSLEVLTTERRSKQSSGNIGSLAGKDAGIPNLREPAEPISTDVNDQNQIREDANDEREPHFDGAPLPAADSLTEDSETISSETSVEGERRKEVMSGRKSRLGRPYSKHSSALNSAKSEPIPENSTEDLPTVKNKKPATAATLVRTSKDSTSPKNKKRPSPGRTDRKEDHTERSDAVRGGTGFSAMKTKENVKSKDSGTMKDEGKTSSPSKRDHKAIQRKSAELMRKVVRRLSSPNRKSIKSVQQAETKTTKQDGVAKHDSKFQAKGRDEETAKKSSAGRSDPSNLSKISSGTRDSTSVAESEVLEKRNSSMEENVRNREEFGAEKNVLSPGDANEDTSGVFNEDLSSTEKCEVHVVSLTKDITPDVTQVKQSDEANSAVQEDRTEDEYDIQESITVVDSGDVKHSGGHIKKLSAKVKDEKQPDSAGGLKKTEKSSEAKSGTESRLTKKGDELQISSLTDNMVTKDRSVLESTSDALHQSSENISNEGDEIKIIITPVDSDKIALPEDGSVLIEEETAFRSDDADKLEPQADIRNELSEHVSLSPEDAIETHIAEEKPMQEHMENELSCRLATEHEQNPSNNLNERESEVKENAERTSSKNVKDTESISGEERKERISVSEREFHKATKRKTPAIKRSVSRKLRTVEGHHEERPDTHVIEENSQYYSEQHESSEYARGFTEHREKIGATVAERNDRTRRNSALELHGKTSKPTKQKLFPAVIHRRRASVPRDSFLSSREDIQKPALSESTKMESDILPDEKHTYKLLTSDYTGNLDEEYSRKTDTGDTDTERSSRVEKNGDIRRGKSTSHSGRSKSADPIASIENNEEHDLPKCNVRDSVDFVEDQSGTRDDVSRIGLQSELTPRSKKDPKHLKRKESQNISGDHSDGKNLSCDSVIQDNDVSCFTEIYHTEGEKRADHQCDGDKELTPESSAAKSFIIPIDQKSRPKKPVQSKTEDISKVMSKDKNAPDHPQYQSKKSAPQKTAHDISETDELTMFCNSMFSADQDRIPSPPSNVYPENKPQKCARYNSYSNLEKPGFLWVHFGSGSSPTKAKPVRDFKRFRVEKKTTKTQITPKDNNTRSSSGKAAVQKRKIQEVKKEKLLRSGYQGRDVREPERKIVSYIKQKEATFTKSEKKKEENAPAKKKFASRTNLMKEDTRGKSEGTAKGGNLPPKKTYPTRIPAARGVNKFSKEKDRSILPARNDKDSEDKKRDSFDKEEDKKKDDDGQKPPTTSESSSLGEGDLRLTIERKTNPEISIKIKVSDNSPKRSDKTRSKPSEDRKKKIVEKSDLSASLSESGYSSVKDSSGYVSTVESIYQNKRNITIDVGNNKAKINTAVSFPTSDDSGALQIRGAKLSKDSKIPVEDKSAQTSGNLKSHTAVHSVVIDVGTNFPAQKIFHHDNLHQIPPPKREPDAKMITPCPLDGLYERMSTESESGSVHAQEDETTASVIPWPTDVDPKDLPTALDKLMDPVETPAKSITESSTKAQQNEAETSEGVESIKEEHSEKGSVDYEESISADTEKLPMDDSQTLPPTVKKKSIPKFPSKIPPPRTYSESSLQSLFMPSDYKTQVQSRSMPTLNEKQVRRISRISRPAADSYKKAGIKGKSKPQAEDTVSRFPAIHPSKTGKFSSKDSIKPPIINFQTESSIRETTMPRITVDTSQDIKRTKGEAAELPSVGQYLKLPILQQPVRCKCTILPQEQLDQRRTKSAVECIANVHFLTDEELARFEQRSRTSHRRILKREETARPSFHPLKYKALRTQTLKYLRAGQTTKDRQPMITFHVDHDKERNTFKLPTNKLNENKKWQVVFTIGKTDEVKEKKADASKK